MDLLTLEMTYVGIAPTRLERNADTRRERRSLIEPDIGSDKNIMGLGHVERLLCFHRYEALMRQTATRSINEILQLSLNIHLYTYIQGVRKFNRQTFRDCQEHHKNHFFQMNPGSETCHYNATT